VRHDKERIDTMRRSLLVKLIAMIALSIVIGVGIFIHAQVGQSPVANAQVGQSLSPLDSEEARDWGKNGLKLDMPTSESKLSEEQAIKAALVLCPGYDKASSVKARYVKIQPADGSVTSWNGNRWIIGFKGIHQLASGGHMYGDDGSAGEWYFDTFYVILNADDGSWVGGFSGTGKRENAK